MDDHNPDLGFLTHIETVRFSGSIARDEVLSSLASKAVAAGWAKPGYPEALLAREAAYPTGLHARGMDLAIPHADPEWTLVPALVVGILQQPASFQPMGGQGPEVLATFVLLLVIPSADAHVEFLRALTGFIEDQRLLEELGRTQNVELLTEYLRSELQPRTT